MENTPSNLFLFKKKNKNINKIQLKICKIAENLLSKLIEIQELRIKNAEKRKVVNLSSVKCFAIKLMQQIYGRAALKSRIYFYITDVRHKESSTSVHEET